MNDLGAPKPSAANLAFLKDSILAGSVRGSVHVWLCARGVRRCALARPACAAGVGRRARGTGSPNMCSRTYQKIRVYQDRSG